MANEINSFSPGVSDEIKHYVYRLIDPRNGQTFYVGKGQGNRLFQHVAAEKIGDKEPTRNDKLKTIHAIRGAGLEVIHVVHRHGMTECIAKEVEAALIDAFLNLTNIASGLGADRGPANVRQLEEHYAMPTMKLNTKDKLLFIKTSAEECSDKGSLYEAVRGAWKINRDRAEQVDYILAVIDQVCKGVFKARDWKPAQTPKRWVFTGYQIDDKEIVGRYVRKRIPDDLYAKGAQNPIQYRG